MIIFLRRAITELYPICRIFVVDTLWRVVVHYEDTRASLEEYAMGNDVSSLAFPPPQESAIGDYLAMRQRFRPLAGREVVYSKPTLPQVSLSLHLDCCVCVALATLVAQVA